MGFSVTSLGLLIVSLLRFDHWDSNQFISNTGIKKTMTQTRFMKLMEYLHVSERANEPAWNNPNYDKLFKIWPVLNMVQQTFKDHYKPSQNQTINEGMVAFKGRLSYMQYLPSKPIKWGIKIWMQCDAESAYLHQFNIYLSWEQNCGKWFGIWCCDEACVMKLSTKTTTSTSITYLHQCLWWMTCCGKTHMHVGQFA